MEVLITDAMRLGGRRMMSCILLLILGYIHYACAAQGDPPTVDSLTPTGTGVSAGGSVNGLWKVLGSPTVTLTCAATDVDTGTTNPLQYVFMKGTELVSGCDWGVDTTCDINAFDKDKAGIYSCNARDGGVSSAEGTAKVVTLTVDCTNLATVCGTPDTDFACQSSDKYCMCVRNTDGVFPSGCDTCTADSECTASATKPYCGGSPKACKECEVPGTGPHKGCNPTSDKPRCIVASGCERCDTKTGGDDVCKNIDGSKPKCNTTNGKCIADPSASTPVTQASGGTTNDDGGATDSKGTTAAVPDSKTSSAGTVTSTACLVIASVVVALMN